MSDQPASISNPSNPADAAMVQAQLRQLAATNPDMRSFMAKLALDGQRVILPVPYWSVVEFSGAPVGGPPATVTIDTTTRKAFQYALGNSMAVAGAPATANATFSDTNLLTQGQTLSNADVWIYGVCLEPLEDAEPLILQALWADGFVEISTDGMNSIRIGTPAMFPGAGGLYGLGQSNALLPPDNVSGTNADAGPGTQYGFLSNGNPMAGNFIRFPQPFKWGAVGGGGADTTLTIGVTLSRALAYTFPAARAAASPTGGYTPPTTRGQPGTSARIRVRLVAQSVGRRGQNT